jgi:hypothetical protein
MTHGKDRSTWPELLYRFVEHYKWEPQHLKGTTKQFYARIRRQEPPLNFVFNVLLRCSSSETILSILRQFGLNDLPADEKFKFEYPWETNFTQPDARIESENTRVFIEIKVGATIDLEQVRRYLALHALMDSEAGEKRPYLLFLTEKQFRKCWKPSREARTADDVRGFLKQKTTDATVPDLLIKRLRDKTTIARYEAVKQEVIYGATTWSAVGKCLKQISSQLHRDGSHDVESRIVDDFLQDLGARELLA